MTIKSIGIDTRASSDKNGKGRYTLEITKALLKDAPNIQFLLFTKTPNPAFNEYQNAKQICICGRGPFWHLNLAKHLKKEPVDMFLAPSSYIYPAIAPKEQSTAIVVHDLITFLHPKDHPFFPTMVERFTLPRAIKKTKFIFCVSENTLKDLHSLFPESKKKHALIATPGVSKDIAYTASQKMDLPEEFIFAVGTLPRKNLARIIEAFSLLNQKDLHLCVAGEKPKKITQNLEPTIAHKVHFFGKVSQGQLCELYSRAKMLVFPSLYEGFGIPPLEAMTCYCPVIVSNTSSLPEVVGESAIKVDPLNVAELRDAIKTLLNKEVALAYARKGQKQAELFSYKNSAKTILKAINS